MIKKVKHLSKDPKRILSTYEKTIIFDKFLKSNWTTKSISVYLNTTVGNVNAALFTQSGIGIIGFEAKSAYNEPVKQKDGTFLDVESQLLSDPYYNPPELKGWEKEIFKNN